ncbi:hypothetical protein [uncultured Methanoregula sp.]|uniref:hypothetical protein n=1 Tax=uncultured Methanoregula sp. TaxID=1005933 RepID=UPI002AAC411C|nr:hypothetical protein [uncultured Methanoregula sp.]
MKKNTKFPAGVKNQILVSIFLFSLLIQAAPAAVQDSPGRITMLQNVPDLNRSGTSPANMTVPQEYQITPTPITIFKAEVTVGSLPGPRDMAYGPSVIGISVDPRSLAVVIVVIVIVVIGGYWFFGKRNRGS